MKHFDLTQMENFLKEENLTMSQIAEELHDVVLEISRLSLYSMEYVKSTEFRITAESASSVLCDLHVLAQSFDKNNMQELFTEADPEDVNKQLRTAVDFYKNVIAGLSFSDQPEVHDFLSGREDYVSMQLTLLRNIAVVCWVIGSQSKEAA